MPSTCGLRRPSALRAVCPSSARSIRLYSPTACSSGPIGPSCAPQCRLLAPPPPVCPHDGASCPANITHAVALSYLPLPAVVRLRDDSTPWRRRRRQPCAATCPLCEAVTRRCAPSHEDATRVASLRTTPCALVPLSGAVATPWSRRSWPRAAAPRPADVTPRPFDALSTPSCAPPSPPRAPPTPSGSPSTPFGAPLMAPRLLTTPPRALAKPGTPVTPIADATVRPALPSHVVRCQFTH
ncbi:hypothetical protein DENSPDRAFT_886929 [Dentipellis sp. KUC8613]|nr:hypothetical protein DENSPDRAFT_886929 [Dentipellis sp. KUC8613]